MQLRARKGCQTCTWYSNCMFLRRRWAVHRKTRLVVHRKNEDVSTSYEVSAHNTTQYNVRR